MASIYYVQQFRHGSWRTLCSWLTADDAFHAARFAASVAQPGEGVRVKESIYVRHGDNLEFSNEALHRVP